MTCGPVPTTFRVLDQDADWSLDLQPTNCTIGDVIELAQLDASAIEPNALAPVMSPPWIARGCEPCEWYILCPPHEIRRYHCGAWVAIACQLALVDPVAVAVTCGHVAVLDAGRRELLILSPDGTRVIAALPTGASGPIAFWATAIVVADHDELVAIDVITLAQRTLPNTPSTIERLVAADRIPFDGKTCNDRTLWAAVDGGNGAIDLLRLDGDRWVPAKLADLAAVARPTQLLAADDQAACIALPRGGDEPLTMCIDRCGNPASAPPASPGPRRQQTGNVVTSSVLDSEIPRCRWHRVRIDVDLPPRTSLEIRLATVENAGDAIADADWQIASATDFLVDQPPGRYLKLRLDLRGDGYATPSIRRVLIDFPRSTSASRLPGVYRDDPIVADFVERFVALFDASIEDLDRVIARFPTLIDPANAPAEALAWLGTFYDIALDPAWSDQTRRALLAEAPALYRRRGTSWALARAIELVTGVTPAIQELGATMPFARTGAFRIGNNRLFGAARARFRLGASALGSAPLRSYGDPDRDAVAAVGWRIAIQVPALAGDPARLRQLVETQKPAHIAYTLRLGAELSQLGVASAIGIDTKLGGLALPSLGNNTRLRRTTALARGSSRNGFVVGGASAIGIQTVLR